MHLYHVCIFLVLTLINIYARPVVPGSVYEKLNISISDLKCPYLQTTKLFEPEPPFLSGCTDFSVTKSLTVLTSSNVNQAVCLLYYNSFEQLCLAASNVSDSFLKTSLSNEIIDNALSTYQKDSEWICSLLKRNRFIIEDAKPGIDTVYKYIQNGECSRICTDFDENLNPACVLTAIMIDHSMKLRSRANYDSPEQPKEMVPKSKPNVTVHMPNSADHPDITQNGVAEENHSNKNPTSTLVDQQSVDTNNNLSLKNNLQNTEDIQSNADMKLELPGNNVQVSETSDNSNSKKMVTQRVPQELNHDLNSDSKTPLPIKQQGILNSETAVPSSNVLDKNTVTDKQNQDVHTQIDQDNNKNEGINESLPETSKNVLPIEEDNNENVNNVEINKNNEIKPEEQKNDLSFSPNLEPPVQANGDKKTSEGVSTTRQKVENNKSTTKNDGEMDLALMENEPDDVVIDKEATERDEQEEYDDADPKFNEVRTKPIEKGKPSETIEGISSFPANYQNQNIDDSDSYFFSYFMMVCIMFICAYVAYHNKQKILALVVEGRKGRRPSRTRRPNSANYRKLDSNLEEAVTSSCNKNATHVIY